MEVLTNNTLYMLSFHVQLGRLDIICIDAVGKNKLL